MWWCLPLLLALPVIAAGTFAVLRYGPKVVMLLDTLLKMVVIP